MTPTSFERPLISLRTDGCFAVFVTHQIFTPLSVSPSFSLSLSLSLCLFLFLSVSSSFSLSLPLSLSTLFLLPANIYSVKYFFTSTQQVVQMSLFCVTFCINYKTYGYSHAPLLPLLPLHSLSSSYYFFTSSPSPPPPPPLKTISLHLLYYWCTLQDT